MVGKSTYAFFEDAMFDQHNQNYALETALQQVLKIKSFTCLSTKI